MTPQSMPATDRRSLLVELRDELRAAFLAADVAVKAQLAGQYRQVLNDLAALPAAVEVSAADEIARARAARRADADGAASTARRSQPRRRAGSNPAG